MSEEKIVYAPCEGGSCHEACVLAVHVKDGRILHTERAVDPYTGEELTQICQKGIECAKLPFIENRIKYPMKRVGKRGEGKFERISWDQAMDEIGAKLNEIKEKYGPESVLVYNFPCGTANEGGSLNYWFVPRFANAFGATIMPWHPIDIQSAHASDVTMGSFFATMGYDMRLARKASLILIWGGNPIGFTRASHTSQYFMDAQENGAKIIDIGIIFDSTAAKADQFIPINPGTDAALALAMANVMLRDNIWNKDFMIKHTVAPFLVRDDNGKFLRESDIVEGGGDSYVYWNKIPVGPRFVAPHELISDEAAPNLFAEVTINGISCKTAMVHIKKLIEPWTPEKQETITGVPAKVAEELAHELTERKDAILFNYWGMRYVNGGYTGRILFIMAAMAGLMVNDIGGLALAGAMGEEYPVNWNFLEIAIPDGDPQKANAKVPVSLVRIMEEGFPYKALLHMIGNPLQNWPNHDLWVNQIYSKLELFVVHEYRMTDTAKFADYIIPDATPLERHELFFRMNRVIYCEPAIEPIEEVRTVVDFWRDLSKRVGVGEYFDKQSFDEWFEIILKTDDPAVAVLDPPLTIERLKKEKMVKLNVPDKEKNIWETLNFDFFTDSGKMELYSEHLADVGGALPFYAEPVIRGPIRKRYPLQFLVSRSRFFMQTQFSDLPDLVYLAGSEPGLRMNPLDAKARGIRDGDLVEVFNERGSFKCRVKLTEGLPPGAVHVLFSHPAHRWNGDAPQALMQPAGVAAVSDPIIRKWGEVMKQRSPLPSADMDLLEGGQQAWESLWDNVCDVRKA